MSFIRKHWRFCVLFLTAIALADYVRSTGFGIALFHAITGADGQKVYVLAPTVFWENGK